MKFLGLITRCKDEFFIKEFCDYYLSQGVDNIFVIDDNSNDKSIYNNINDDKVKIIYEKDLFKNKHQMQVLNKYYLIIKNLFKWVISVDVDEFIVTKKYINNTIRDELETSFKDIDCIKIPWVMMSCNGRKKNPKSILLENTSRWDHNKKHPHKIIKFRCRYNEIEVKCIFKTSKYNFIDVHHPVNLNTNTIVVNSINKQIEKLTPFYNNLREIDISTGYLLCYHYRTISEENSKNKLKKAQYLKYTIQDIISSDHSEILDETLKYKIKDII